MSYCLDSHAMKASFGFWRVGLGLWFPLWESEERHQNRFGQCSLQDSPQNGCRYPTSELFSVGTITPDFEYESIGSDWARWHRSRRWRCGKKWFSSDHEPSVECMVPFGSMVGAMLHL